MVSYLCGTQLPLTLPGATALLRWTFSSLFFDSYPDQIEAAQRTVLGPGLRQ